MMIESQTLTNINWCIYSIGRVLISSGGVSIGKERTTRVDSLIVLMHRRFYAIITKELSQGEKISESRKWKIKSNELLLLLVVVDLCPHTTKLVFHIVSVFHTFHKLSQLYSAYFFVFYYEELIGKLVSLALQTAIKSYRSL